MMVLHSLVLKYSKKHVLYNYIIIQYMPYHKAKKRTLTQRQKDTLARHKSHHSKKHMDMMKSKMKQGMTFKKAHDIAMKKVGK